MADDYLKYVTASGVEDPYSTNPFASEISPEPAESPFEMQLPFRFTQFAINPTAAATSGMAGRTPVARSPFTSGAEARELSMLRDRIKGLSGEHPGEAPIMPVFTPSPPQVTPESTGIQSNLRWGLPIKEYQVPSRLLEDYKGRNPLDLAIRYSAGQPLYNPSGGTRTNIDYGKYKDSPMTSISGYDVEQLVGSDKWSSILSAKNLGKGEEQRFFYNLALLPTDINPDLGNKEHLTSLATRDFTNPNRSLVLNPDAIAAAREMGVTNPENMVGTALNALLRDTSFNGPLYVADPNYEFNPKDVEYFLRTNPEQSGLRGFMQKWAPTAIQAGAAGVIGGAAGGALAPMIGAGTGGIGGALGVEGALASGVNFLGNTAMGVGLSQGLSAAGVDLSNPLAQFLVQTGGAAMGGAMQGGAPSGEGWTPENINKAIELSAAEYNLSPDEFVKQMGGAYTSANELSKDILSLGFPVGTSQGIDLKRPGMQGIMSGMQTYAGMTGQPTGGGINIAETDPRYASEMAAYEQEMAAYQQMLQEFQLKEMLQSEYEAKQEAFAQKSREYGDYQKLRARQSGITSNIQQNIAANPYYDVIENYTGIQSEFVR